MATTLLNALASVPSKQLVEGAQVEVTKTDGTVFTVTFGERVKPSDDEDVLQISFHRT